MNSTSKPPHGAASVSFEWQRTRMRALAAVAREAEAAADPQLILECKAISAAIAVIELRRSRPDALADTKARDAANEPLPASPCVRLCRLDQDDTCIGCGRTLTEIAEWPRAGREKREAILALAAGRRPSDQRS